MTVFHIITSLTTGGAERALYNVLAGGLIESNNTAVLSLQDEGTYGERIRALDVPVYTLGMHRRIPTPATLWRLRQAVAELRPQLIQGWMYHGNLAASTAARMIPRKNPAVIWNIRHSLYSLKAEKPLTQQVIRANRWAAGGVDAIIYNSRIAKKQHEAFGFAATKSQVIPNGFDTYRLAPNSDRGRATRGILDIPEEATVIGHVARFHPIKDHASFLRAAVAVMHQKPDLICLLVGREVDLENPALADVVPPELADRFCFVGERKNISDLMRAMDVFCQSSRSEGFPNVLGEAMALGVPCVATDVGDSRDIVGDTGEVVPPSDSEALAKGLLAMLDRTSEERTALGRAARTRIETRYALPSVVEQYRELYERVTNE